MELSASRDFEDSRMIPCNAVATLYLQGDINFDRNHPIDGGGYGELFAGSHASDGKVALKRLLIRGNGTERQRDAMAEASVWRALVHPNVLPFLGILFEEPNVYLVSPLVEQGSLPRYISNHPDADRSNLLRDVAKGLTYLHSQGIVHGDVKGTNVLVQQGPRAVLCDFGLLKILATATTTTKGGLGTHRWQSPELMESGARSFEADVYAYGITIYEILSGRFPFQDLLTDSMVTIAVIVRDERPSFEALIGSYSTFRDAATRCWERLPRRRPTMAEVSWLLSPQPPTLEESLQAFTISLSAENQSAELSDLAKDGQNQRSNQSLPGPVEVATLEAHTSSVNSIAFSPDGSCLASGSRDKTVKLWNLASSAMELTLRGHSDGISGVAFSPDGSRVASGSYDNTVRLWDTVHGAEVATLHGHTNYVKTVAFSAEGSRIASGSDDLTVRVWDAISGAEILTLKGHTDLVMSVAFSPDGLKLASGSNDKTVKLWDATSGAKLKTLRGHTARVTSVAFFSDGMQLASGSWDDNVRVWNVVSGKEIKTLGGHTRCVDSVTVSPDGLRVASGSRDNTIRLWDVTSGATIQTLEGDNSWVRSVAFSPDGKRLASGGDDRTIRIWELE